MMFIQLYNLLSDVTSKYSCSSSEDSKELYQELSHILQQSTLQSVTLDKFSITYFRNLQQYEEAFYTRKFNIDVVKHLVQYYAQLVEYFDASKNGLKAYFLDKLQYLLQQPETITLLLDDSFDANNQKQKEFTSYSDQERPTVRYSIYKKKSDRAFKLRIMIDVEEQKDKVQQDLNQLLKEYEKTSKEYDQIIKQQLDDQQVTMQEKLRQRQEQRLKHNKVRRTSSCERLQQIPFKHELLINDEEYDSVLPQENNTSIHLGTFHSPTYSKSGSLQFAQNRRQLIIEELSESVSFMRNTLSRVSQRSFKGIRQQQINLLDQPTF